jgi:hypothetical protein
MLCKCGSSYEILGLLMEAFAEYSEALKIKEMSASVLELRAGIHYTLKQYEDCIIDCEASLEAGVSEGAQKLLEETKALLESSPERCCYEILGIAASATSVEIKTAYRMQSLKFHPDQDATKVETKKLERKFLEVKKAHDVAMAKLG